MTFDTINQLLQISLISISVFPGSGGSQFLTSGEDKTVRVWKGILYGVVVKVQFERKSDGCRFEAV